MWISSNGIPRCFEQHLGAYAVAAPVRRVELDLRHSRQRDVSALDNHPVRDLHWPEWQAAAGKRRRSCCARSATGRPTASSTSSRSTGDGWARSPRARARRARASARGSSRSATSSSCSTRAAASCTPSPASHLVRSHEASRARTLPDGGRPRSGSRRCCGSSSSRRRMPAAFHALVRFLDLLDDVDAAAAGEAGARPACALVPAEAPLARRLSAASRRLRRLRGGGAARRILRPGRRRGVRGCEASRRDLAGGIRGDPRPARASAGRSDRDRDLRSAAARDAPSVIESVLRVPRRIPPRTTASAQIAAGARAAPSRT